jgi:hypothetical protein
MAQGRTRFTRFGTHTHTHTVLTCWWWYHTHTHARTLSSHVGGGIYGTHTRAHACIHNPALVPLFSETILVDARLISSLLAPGERLHDVLAFVQHPHSLLFCCSSLPMIPTRNLPKERTSKWVPVTDGMNVTILLERVILDFASKELNFTHRPGPKPTSLVRPRCRF